MLGARCGIGVVLVFVSRSRRSVDSVSFTLWEARICLISLMSEGSRGWKSSVREQMRWVVVELFCCHFVGIFEFLFGGSVKC